MNYTMASLHELLQASPFGEDLENLEIKEGDYMFTISEKDKASPWILFHRRTKGKNFGEFFFVKSSDLTDINGKRGVRPSFCVKNAVVWTSNLDTVIDIVEQISMTGTIED